jgi:hypothetical protein
VFKPEMELLLRVAGFPRAECRLRLEDFHLPAPEADRPLREGDVLLWTAWKD